MTELKFEDLTDSQQEAADHKEGALLVRSGAGSGKTTVLKHRYEKMLDKGVDPSNILLTTFTNNAAHEIEERVEGIDDEEETYIGTIHSLFYDLIKDNKELFGFNEDEKMGVYNQWEQQDITEEILRDELPNPGNIDQDMIESTAKVFAHNFAVVRRELIMPEDIERELETGGYEMRTQIGSRNYEMINNWENLFPKVFHEYLDLLQERNQIDFTGMEFYAYKIFTEDKEMLEYYRDKFQYIIVDEAQDLSTLEWTLFDQLAREHGNIALIGDSAQNIYEWRGSDHRFLNQFVDYYDPEIVTIDTNFRSSSQILKSVNSIVQELGAGVNQKILESHKGEMEESEDHPKVNVYPHPGLEVEGICDKIDRLVNEEDVEPEEIGVLSRRGRNLYQVEQALRFDYNIPVYNDRGTDFVERDEVSYVLDFLKAYIKQEDDLIISRTAQEHVRGCGKSKVTKAKEAAQNRNMNLVDYLAQLEDDNDLRGVGKKNAMKMRHFAAFVQNLDEFQSPMKEILDNQGKWKNKIMSEVDWDSDRRDNIQQITRQLKQKGGFNRDAVEEFLDELVVEEGDESEGKVFLSTIHGAKGREWEATFLFEANDNILPSYNSDNIEEEKRLFYVAVSRAKEKCFISYHQNDGGTNRSPSEFLQFLEVPGEVEAVGFD